MSTTSSVIDREDEGHKRYRQALRDRAFMAWFINQYAPKDPTEAANFSADLILLIKHQNQAASEHYQKAYMDLIGTLQYSQVVRLPA